MEQRNIRRITSQRRIARPVELESSDFSQSRAGSIAVPPLSRENPELAITQLTLFLLDNIDRQALQASASIAHSHLEALEQLPRTENLDQVVQRLKQGLLCQRCSAAPFSITEAGYFLCGRCHQMLFASQLLPPSQLRQFDSPAASEPLIDRSQQTCASCQRIQPQFYEQTQRYCQSCVLTSIRDSEPLEFFPTDFIETLEREQVLCSGCNQPRSLLQDSIVSACHEQCLVCVEVLLNSGTCQVCNTQIHQADLDRMKTTLLKECRKCEEDRIQFVYKPCCRGPVCLVCQVVESQTYCCQCRSKLPQITQEKLAKFKQTLAHLYREDPSSLNE